MSREVLAPPLLRMGPNRCYRVNLIHEDFGGNPQQTREMETSQKGYLEQDMYAEDDDEDDMTDCLVEELPNSLFKLSMHVAQSFYGGLIGFKGATKRRIEVETRTEIYIPRSQVAGTAKKDEILVIKGQTRSSVCSARRQINLLIHSLRKRMSATHFIGVPLNEGEVLTKFLQFKKQILDSNLPGIDESLFNPESRLHLTLTVCVLLDDAERLKAIELLQSCREFLNDLRTPFPIKISGLEIMNDDPSAVRVVYARVDAPELQKFSDRALVTLLRSGLATDQFNRGSVKLHMTVMNVKFLKKINPNAPDTFDARAILKRYNDFDFGSTECHEIQLCIRGAYVEEGASRGYYKTSTVLKF